MTMNLVQGVSKKKSIILLYIKHAILNRRFNDEAFVRFVFVVSNYVFLIGRL
jgi:hypothetical protein